MLPPSGRKLLERPSRPLARPPRAIDLGGVLRVCDPQRSRFHTREAPKTMHMWCTRRETCTPCPKQHSARLRAAYSAPDSSAVMSFSSSNRRTRLRASERERGPVTACASDSAWRQGPSRRACVEPDSRASFFSPIMERAGSFSFWPFSCAFGAGLTRETWDLE
jgi:hypothetical protein